MPWTQPNLLTLQGLYQVHDSSFEVYASLLRKWQNALNLVSRETLNDLKNRHFLDSLQLVFHIPYQTDALIVDCGSGAGFPGLVLSLIGYPRVVLIEVDKKKALFLKTVILALQLKTQVLCERLENLNDLQADYCISRAFAPLERCTSLVYPILHKDSVCLFHKGAHVEKEIEVFKKSWYGQLEIFPSLISPQSFIVKLSHVFRH